MRLGDMSSATPMPTATRQVLDVEARRSSGERSVNGPAGVDELGADAVDVLDGGA